MTAWSKSATFSTQALVREKRVEAELPTVPPRRQRTHKPIVDTPVRHTERTERDDAILAVQQKIGTDYAHFLQTMARGADLCTCPKRVESTSLAKERLAEVLREPVLCSDDDWSQEEEAISAYVQDTGTTPVTGEVLSLDRILPIYIIRQCLMI